MRKTISITMLLCIVSSALTQSLQIEDTLNTTSQRWRDTCFGLISKSTTLIPSGYLIDYSLAVMDKDFDGSGNNDTLKAYGDFFYYYHILEASKVNSNGNLQGTDDLFISAKRYMRDSNSTIPLLFLYQSYQQIDPNALSNNLFTLTSDSVRLMDVSGRSSSPYTNKELFIFSPIKTVIAQFNSIAFSFPSSFWKMNGISSVTINFDDGQGNRTISSGGTVNIYYATEGYKTITATISTANGNRTAKCRIKYTRPEYYLQPDTSWNISVTPVYTDESDYLGNSRTSRVTSICDAGTVFDRVNCDINPGAEVRVINGCDQVFDKPIIIVEGFDTDGALDIDELFRRFRLYNFIEGMRSAGYDFVFVNFKNPLTFIENNAKVLEEVINQVNATKVGNARGSVIGFSMGGLVARWCLKDMEDRSIDHKMDHYFSYDSPHQGANIPLGLQYLFGEMENDLSWLKWKDWGGYALFPDFYNLAFASHSPAAKQMLVTKGNYSNWPLLWDPTLGTLDPIRAAFAERLVQKGYPQNLTCHGIAFGRGNNTVNTKNAGNGNQFGSFSPGSKIFDGSIFLSLINITSSAFAVQENNTNDYICRYRFLGIKVVRIFNANIAIASSFRVRNFKYTGQYPYDDAPGSYETTQTQFVNQFQQFKGLATDPTNLGHHGHNFVSTASALDLQNQGYSSSTSWQSNNMFFNVDNNITSPGQVAGNTISSTLSPFHDVLTYTSDCGSITCESINDDVDNDGFLDVKNNNWNQYHNGFISRQSSQYIQRKILNATPGTTCPGICDNTNNISGNAWLCTSEIYQLTGTSPVGLNILWESENGKFEITSGQGTTQITATKIANGADYIRVTLTNSCGSNRVIHIPVTVGLPTINFTQKTISCVNNKPYFTGAVAVISGATNYAWYAKDESNSSNPFVLKQSENSNTADFPLGNNNGNRYYTIRVIVTTPCGNSQSIDEDGYIYAPSCSGGGGGARIIASPNPAKTKVSIELIDEESSTESSNKIYELDLMDKTGIVLGQYKYKDGVSKATVDISKFRSGLYLIRIWNGKEWLGTQIIKE